MTEILEMHLTLPAGREVDAARVLWGKLDVKHRAILAALAAELLALHEQAVGSTVVVVTGAAQAERVLRDLRRDQPLALVPTV